MKNTETGETSGLGSDIDGENAAAASAIDLNVKPTISDANTQKIINELYEGQGKKGQIGSGSMMDAVRNERKTGKPTKGKFHSTKAKGKYMKLECNNSEGILAIKRHEDQPPPLRRHLLRARRRQR